MNNNIVTTVIKTFGELYGAILKQVRLSRLSNPQTFIIVLLIIILPCLLLSYWIWTAREKPVRLVYRGVINAASDNHSIPDVQVSMRGRTDIAPTTSNTQGAFTLDLPAVNGQFQGTVLARHPDFTDGNQDITLQANTTGKPILLVPKPPPEHEWGGVVRDARGAIVVGATVLVEGVSASTRTGPDGRFSLKARTNQTANFVLITERDGRELGREYCAPSQNCTITTRQTKE